MSSVYFRFNHFTSHPTQGLTPYRIWMENTQSISMAVITMQYSSKTFIIIITFHFHNQPSIPILGFHKLKSQYEKAQHGNMSIPVYIIFSGLHRLKSMRNKISFVGRIYRMMFILINRWASFSEFTWQCCRAYIRTRKYWQNAVLQLKFWNCKSIKWQNQTNLVFEIKSVQSCDWFWGLCNIFCLI